MNEEYTNNIVAGFCREKSVIWKWQNCSSFEQLQLESFSFFYTALTSVNLLSKQFDTFVWAESTCVVAKAKPIVSQMDTHIHRNFVFFFLKDNKRNQKLNENRTCNLIQKGISIASNTFFKRNKWNGPNNVIRFATTKDFLP